MWTEIFKTGKWTDSRGDTRTWTEDDLCRIADSYDPKAHEAPVVVGHPADNSPAYGWVDELKHEGGVLYAKLKELAPEFVDWLRMGFYKKRSVSLYPDLSLRHVGFLGGSPPAIKGLSNIKFGEGGECLELVIPNEKEEQGDSYMEEKLQEFQERAEALEEEMKKKDDKLVEAEGKAESSAQAKQSAEAELMRMNVKMRKMEFQQFLQSEIAAGRLTPGLEEIVMKLLEALSTIDFAEDSNSPVGLLKDLVKRLPKQIEFREIATKRDASNTEAIEEKRLGLISEYMNKNTGATWRDAVLAVSSERPELFKEV